MFTVSQLKDYLRCPAQAFFIHELRRVPSASNMALGIGTLFHEQMALLLVGKYNKVLAQLPSWKLCTDEVQDAYMKHYLYIVAERYYINPAWEIIHIEKALEDPGINLQGRLDAIVKWNGKYWSLQWKTYSNDLAGLQEKVRLGYHEVAYQHLASINGYTPWGGTILGACQKLPSYRMAPDRRSKYMITPEDRQAAFTTHYLTRSPDEQASLLDNLTKHLERMSRDWALRLKNTDSCFGMFGNSRCPYFQVCHQGGSIGSGNYKTAEPRY